MRDVGWDIRVLRTVRRYGGRYSDVLSRLGDPTRTSGAVQRLRRAGYIVEDMRRLKVTADGEAALGRLGDAEIREKVLTIVFYGPGVWSKKARATRVTSRVSEPRPNRRR